MHFKLIIAFVEDSETQAVLEASRKAVDKPAQATVQTVAEPAETQEQKSASGRESDMREALRDLVLRDRAIRTPPVPETGSDGEANRQLAETAANRSRASFSRLLARRLGATQALSDRILMDNSGRQLVMTLQTLAMDDRQILATVEAVFPHLGAQCDGERTIARCVLEECDPGTSRRKVAAWIRANLPRPSENARHAPQLDETGERSAPANGREYRIAADEAIQTGKPLKRA